MMSGDSAPLASQRGSRVGSVDEWSVSQGMHYRSIIAITGNTVCMFSIAGKTGLVSNTTYVFFNFNRFLFDFYRSFVNKKVMQCILLNVLSIFSYHICPSF